MKVNLSDTTYMQQAILLAKRGWYTARPNPRVGCVLVKNSQVIAEGWHEKAGEDHAEAMALRKAGASAQGCTAYVTLEPCSFHGRTPACAQALIDAGVATVVVAGRDPHPKVAGAGFKGLRAAGIEVREGVLEASAAELNKGFLLRHSQGRPWVTCKLAMSLDGRTAMASGESQWITAAQARADVQRLRAQSCAILTGSGTVLHDNPSMTVRSVELLDEGQTLHENQPLRVVLDRQNRCKASAKIFSQAGNTLLIGSGDVELDRVEAIKLAPFSLRAVMSELADRDCNDVLLECGPSLAGAMLDEGLIDEFFIYVAAKLMGRSAQPLFGLTLNKMSEAIDLDIQDIRAVGSDWRIHAVPVRS